MNGSISDYVRKVITASPFISELMLNDVISYSNLASFIRPKVEEMYGHEVRIPAVIMAVRRYAENLKKTTMRIDRGKIAYQISLKSNIYDINFIRSDLFIERLQALIKEIDVEGGDFLNITLGDRETSLCVSDKFEEKAKEIIGKNNIVYEFKDCSAISIIFRDDSFLKTPGLLYLAVKKLAWDGINVIEVISTAKFLTFVVKREEGSRAYEALEKFLSEEVDASHA